MAELVTKKDGSTTVFDLEKIKSSIMFACTDAGLTDDEKNKVTKEMLSSLIIDLESKKEISTAEIKLKVLAELDKSYPVVSEAWRKYDQTYHK